MWKKNFKLEFTLEGKTITVENIYITTSTIFPMKMNNIRINNEIITLTLEKELLSATSSESELLLWLIHNYPVNIVTYRDITNSVIELRNKT